MRLAWLQTSTDGAVTECNQTPTDQQDLPPAETMRERAATPDLAGLARARTTTAFTPEGGAQPAMAPSMLTPALGLTPAI